MTIERRDGKGTEFGRWWRNWSLFPSDDGWLNTDVDYVWREKETNKYLCLEEKTFNKVPTQNQVYTFGLMDKALRNDPLYHGFHLLNFEYTTPLNGKMWLNHELVTIYDLEVFFRFRQSREWYLANSMFPL